MGRRNDDDASKPRTSTVGRGKAITLDRAPDRVSWSDEKVAVYLGDSLELYKEWDSPVTIVSDGGYGVLGFEGDTSDHLGLSEWYEPHIAAWSEFALPATTLWFWNSEVGWAAVHDTLERHGWRYVSANIWNKGKGHIAGNVNTAKIRRFPVVTEVCVQYVREVRINGRTLKEWLRHEWDRTGLPLSKANEACGVADAAVRKYLDQGHLWYFPPPDRFERMVDYANEHGDPGGRPYFSRDGTSPMTGKEWEQMRSKFDCPHGITNVWERPALRGKERVTTDSGKAVHLNQKPLDLIELLVKTSTEARDVVWEPFGGLFTAALAASRLDRRAFGAETDATYFQYGVNRLIQSARQYQLL